MAARQAQIDASVYLTGLGKKYPDLTVSLAKDPLTQLDKLCAQISTTSNDLEYHEIERILIDSKAKFSFIWSLAEFANVGSVEQRGQWQTRFAEVTTDLALRCAWTLIAAKHKSLQQTVQQSAGKVAGLFIFGMGKLGGGDLNFSSDIDLIAYFDSDVLPIPDMLGKSYICHQVLQLLTRLLSQNGGSNFIWRVDWRLRPNASANTLALSTAAARDYYFYRASPWHRLALMKARVVAGDLATGQLFLNAITPFIWRQNLDYRALDELAEIKSKINLDHPGLRVERQQRQAISEEIGGFNVKLGTGGIREIEFTANALQLIWGGKQYALRTPHTVTALKQLASLGHLDNKLSKKLIRSYRYLRRVENAIQIFANQQSHLIPAGQEQRKKLLILLGENKWSNLVRELNFHRRHVSEYFEELFASHDAGETGETSWPQSLSSVAMEQVDDWDHGFVQYGVSVGLRQRLKPLNLALADYLRSAEKNRGFDSSRTVLRLHDFFRALPQGEQYFRLLAESPYLLASMIPPLLYSPAMSSLLKQSPHIIDCFVGQKFSPGEGFDSQYVLQAKQYEIRLERMRRFVNEHLYQLYLLFLTGELGVVAFQTALTELAEHSLELALTVVMQNMELDAPPITVLGMGKLAMGCMSPLSDLDLIFIFDPQRTSIETASKFVRRLQTAISTPMREGIVYELDTRLRPSGRAGAPTVSIESFAKHQLERAHTWEHIALVAARVVAGDRSLEQRIDAIKKEVISTPRDQNQLLSDAAKMWQRISEHRVKAVDSIVMFSKLRPGGLMQSEYLAACMMLKYGTEFDWQAQELHTPTFQQLLMQCVSRGSESLALPQILQFWRIQQLWERLLGLSEKPVENLPADYLQRLLEHSGVDSLEDLLTRKHDYANEITSRMEKLFADIDRDPISMKQWQESNVIWTK